MGTEVDADAPLASDNDIPAIPRIGNSAVCCFRFEGFFARGIVDTSQNLWVKLQPEHSFIALYARFGYPKVSVRGTTEALRSANSGAPGRQSEP